MRLNNLFFWCFTKDKINETINNVLEAKFDINPKYDKVNLRKKYGTNVIAIRKNQKIEIDIDPNLELKEDMKLVVLTSKAKIKKII